MAPAVHTVRSRRSSPVGGDSSASAHGFAAGHPRGPRPSQPAALHPALCDRPFRVSQLAGIGQGQLERIHAIGFHNLTEAQIQRIARIEHEVRPQRADEARRARRAQAFTDPVRVLRYLERRQDAAHGKLRGDEQAVTQPTAAPITSRAGPNQLREVSSRPGALIPSRTNNGSNAGSTYWKFVGVGNSAAINPAAIRTCRKRISGLSAARPRRTASKPSSSSTPNGTEAERAQRGQYLHVRPQDPGLALRDIPFIGRRHRIGDDAVDEGLGRRKPYGQARRESRERTAAMGKSNPSRQTSAPDRRADIAGGR